MVELTARRGYHAIRVVDLTRLARVSRPTFYSLYADKEECFLGAYDEIAKRMSKVVVDAFMGARGREARVGAAMSAFADLALKERDATLLMVLGALGSGPRALKRHHRVLTVVQNRLEGKRIDAARPSDDLTMNMIIGGIREVTAKRLRHDLGSEMPDLVDELTAWALSYPAHAPASLVALSQGANGRLDVAAGEPAGKAEGGGGPPGRGGGRPTRGGGSSDGRGAVERGPGAGRLPSGRHDLSKQFVVENQRERIVDAIAEIVAEKGYPALTIPAIAKRANISHQTFYEIYPTKQAALLGAQEAGILQGVQAGGSAYEAQAEDWPSAVTEGIRAAIGYFAAEPAYTRLNLVDVLAAGPEALTLREAGLRRYSGFLEPGLELGRAPKIAPEAVAGGAWQILHQYVVRDRIHELPGLIPQLSYLVLTPFVGPGLATRVARRQPR
jgi:AcrR family transcriptional regulator